MSERYMPIGSMYGVFSYVWLIFMVKVGKCSIHGSWILWDIEKRTLPDVCSGQSFRKIHPPFQKVHVKCFLFVEMIFSSQEAGSNPPHSRKTRISAENQWLEDEMSFWNGPFSGSISVLRGGILIELQAPLIHRIHLQAVAHNAMPQA